ATATLAGSKSCVYSVSIPSPTPKCSTVISGYTQSNVSFVGNTTATGILTVGSDHKQPAGFQVVNPGSGYTGTTWGPANLTLTSGSWAGGGDCSNLQATITPGYLLSSITVTSAGHDYTSLPAISVSGGSGTTSQATATASLAFRVASVTLTGGGAGYTSIPSVTFTGGGGSGAAATDTIITSSTTTYPVQSVAVSIGGNGYTSIPLVS